MTDTPALFATQTWGSEERGSLALTKDGPVLGCPRDLPMETRIAAAHRVTDWLDHGGAAGAPVPSVCRGHPVIGDD